MKRIIIIGDSAMGKTTFAKKLSSMLGIPMYSTDDFFYVKKYTHKRDIQEAKQMALNAFTKKQWIMEGTTRRLITPGLSKADTIFYFKSKSLLRQYYVLFTRKDENQDLYNLVSLAKYLFMKRFSIGNAKKVSYDELLKPYMDKVTTVHNFKEVDEVLNNIT